MRNWVEKLSKISKERGVSNNGRIVLKEQLWWELADWNRCHNIKHADKELCVCLNDTNRFEYIRIYDDEYDVLKECQEYVQQTTKDYILEFINIL